MNEISPFNFKNPLKSNEKKSLELHFKWMINNLKFDKTMAYNQFIMHSIFGEGESVFMGSRWKRFDKHYFSLRKLSIPVFLFMMCLFYCYTVHVYTSVLDLNLDGLYVFISVTLVHQQSISIRLARFNCCNVYIHIRSLSNNID